MAYKLIIAGGRDFIKFPGHNTVSSVNACIKTILAISEVVSGAARGGDKCGEAWAARYGIPIKQFPADWDKYGKSAGYRRNAEMAAYADALLAFWDGESKGTKHMIDLAIKHNLKLKVMSYDGKDITHTVQT